MGLIKAIIDKSELCQAEIARESKFTEANLSIQKNTESKYLKKIARVMSGAGVNEVTAEENGMVITIKLKQ